MDWTQAVCDDCFPTRWPGTPNPHHRMVEEYRVTEKCCYCGRPTRSGLYCRADPATVPYPSNDD